MRACASESAFAHTSRTPSSTKFEAVKIEASTSEPMATTARSTSSMPSCVSTAASEVSACTVCVSSGAISRTNLSEASMPSTSTPWSMSSRANAWPKRPRPTTTTGAMSMVFREPKILTNEGPFLGVAKALRDRARGERRDECGGADAAQIHNETQDNLGRCTQRRGNAGG